MVSADQAGRLAENALIPEQFQVTVAMENADDLDSRGQRKVEDQDPLETARDGKAAHVG